MVDAMVNEPGVSTTAGGDRRPRRRRFLIPVIVVLGIVVLVVAAELVLRAVVDHTIASKVEESLPDSTSGSIDAHASGIVIPQLIAGKLDDITITSTNLKVGGVPLSAHVEAHDLRTDGTGAAHRVKGTIRLASGSVHKLSTYSAIFSRLSLVDGGVRLKGSTSVLGYSIEYAARGTVAVQDDGKGITITPKTMRIVNGSLGVHIDSIPGVLNAPVSVCTAQFLPKELRLGSLDITSTAATLRISADRLPLSDKALTSTGSCS